MCTYLIKSNSEVHVLMKRDKSALRNTGDRTYLKLMSAEKASYFRCVFKFLASV